MDTPTHRFVFVIWLVSMGKLTDGQNLLRNCAEEIIGCGVTVGSDLDTIQCNCMGYLNTGIPFDLALFCALQDTPPECCPCQNAAFFRGNSPTQKLKCADKGELHTLKRLVKKATRIGQKIAKRCPDGIDKSCPSKLLRKVDKLTAEIKIVSAKIAADYNDI